MCSFYSNSVIVLLTCGRTVASDLLCNGQTPVWKGRPCFALWSCLRSTWLLVLPTGPRLFTVAENAASWEQLHWSGLTPGPEIRGTTPCPCGLRVSGVTSQSKGGRITLLREFQVPWRDHDNHSNTIIVAHTHECSLKPGTDVRTSHTFT